MTGIKLSQRLGNELRHCDSASLDKGAGQCYSSLLWR